MPGSMPSEVVSEVVSEGTSTAQVDATVAAVRELVQAVDHYRTGVAMHLGLTANESQAVSYLLTRGPIGQGDLASAMSFTTSSTTALVDRLERRGFAERRHDPADRRRTIIALSARGEAELDEVRTWMAQAVTGLEDDELAVARDLLLTLAAGLRDVIGTRLGRAPSVPRSRRRD